MNRISRGLVIGAAALAVALVSAGLIAFFAWPTSSQQGSEKPTPVPRFVLRFADQQHVTKLVGHGSRSFAWFKGRDQEGKAVVSVGIGGQWLTPFISAQRFSNAIAHEKVHVFTADGGPKLDTLGYRQLGGLVAPAVRQVKVLFDDGGSRTLAITDGTFYYRSRVTTTHFPTKVVAYDSSGAPVATKNLSRPAAPGAQ
jgi:hypothetical protein